MKPTIGSYVSVAILAMILCWFISKSNDELLKYVDTKIEIEINRCKNEQLKHYLEELNRWKEWSERMMEKHRRLTDWMLEKQKRERGATKT